MLRSHYLIAIIFKSVGDSDLYPSWEARDLSVSELFIKDCYPHCALEKTCSKEVL